ncbi:MAG TPA: NAD(P)H-dependent oxidoreductase, partial [Balneolaceae bacterium]|nr:NAD(P)H-dependent oxidoreductase [Balneolaceae bacterium]
EVALRAASKTYGVDTEILHLAEYDLQTADGRKLDAYTGDTARALERIINSKSYIIGTPVYRGSYSGVLKNLFDMIPRGMWQAEVAPLADKAVGLVVTGATAHHFLSVSQELGPVLSFFGSYPVGSGVYGESADFEDYEVVNTEVQTRLQNLGKATIELSRAIDESDYLRDFGPQF